MAGAEREIGAAGQSRLGKFNPVPGGRAWAGQEEPRRAEGVREFAQGPTRVCQDGNTVAWAFSKLRQFRAVACRCGKRERIYQGTIDIASVRIWLRGPVTETTRHHLVRLVASGG